MVRLEKEMAVIGATYELLKNKQEPVLDIDVLLQYIKAMEIRSGLAVMPGFSAKSLDLMFRKYECLFERYVDTDGKITYKPKTGRDDADTFAMRMLDHMDPALNYPYGFIESTGLLPVLESPR